MAQTPHIHGSADNPRVLEVLRRVWGYESLRPLQAEAIAAGLDRQDALVVLPTGGGKSLCFQVPPLVAGRTDVVVCPLIALMKDQVDALRQVGYPAAALHSNLSAEERKQVEQGIREKKYRLIYVSPERLVTPWFLGMAHRAGICSFAIDEAHCISQWGHDFRPEYRQLAVLREMFPGGCIHAYTATATPRVREDIVNQLKLHEPRVLVGTFDRPNLTYRVLPQIDLDRQVIEVLRRHTDEAAIVYCLSRKDTESLAATLRGAKIKAEHYHAGLSAQERRATQERFATERTDVVVATIAFGMGIDRNNVRAVIHACLPKSIENYQQETGRAGRDSLPAECVLFYSQADVLRLERVMERSAEEAEDVEAATANLKVQMDLLRRMRGFASAAQCRHRALSEYFGQRYERQDCQACDVCLGEVEGVADSTIIAQKILSCVARVEQRFGVGHITDVLAGAKTERIQQLGHDQLSTHGLLADVPKKAIQGYIYQLIDQGLLARSEDEYPILLLNEASWQVMRGQRKARLIQPKKASRKRQDRAAAGMADDGEKAGDQGLFEHLRQVRRDIARDQGVPAFVVMHDRTLLELARVRPTDTFVLEEIHGMGEHKCELYGARLLEEIRVYCRQNGLTTDRIAPGGRRRRE